MNQPLSLVSWPNVILHVDGDSFFASVEQALNPSLKGKPIVTGQERGIASAISIEGKRLGISRGMPIALIKRNYPECIVVPGDYEAYMAFAKRMFDVMRRYTPLVEEYSIDEAFADLTGMRRYLNASYEEIGKKIQDDIRKELDITVSVGISLTKTLAKLCSKFRKPNGITCVKGRHIHILLQKNSIDKVWGIGHSISSFLKKYGCITAYDFATKPLSFVENHLTKKELEIYKELRGELMYPVDSSKKETYQSISKAKTFSPTSKKEEVFAQLVKNIEEASAKCRKYSLSTKEIIIAIRTQQFRVYGQKAKLNRLTSSAIELVGVASEMFDKIFLPSNQYRQTMCILTKLSSVKYLQLSMFDYNLSIEKLDNIDKSIDEINKRFGRGTIHILEGLPAFHKSKQELKLPKLLINV